MTQLAFDAVVAAVTSKKSRKKAWTPPRAAELGGYEGDFAYGLVQAFDQTLTNTGMVIIRSNEAGVHLLAASMIRPPESDLKSIEATYAKSVAIELGIRRARHGLAAMADWVVYERPPTGGMRIESSLMAGREVYRATDGNGVMVDNRHAKVVLTGRAGTRADPVTKAHVKEAVERYLTPATAMPWNEHVRDAAMLGLVHLFDMKQKGVSAE